MKSSKKIGKNFDGMIQGRIITMDKLVKNKSMVHEVAYSQSDKSEGVTAQNGFCLT